VTPFQKGQILGHAPVWKGVEKEVGLAAGEHGAITVPMELKESVTYTTNAPERFVAPLQLGQALGEAVISAKNQVLKTVPLIADRNIPQAGFFKRAVDSVILMASGHRTRLVVIGIVVAVGIVGLLLLLFFLRPRKVSKH
jgi:D-alanyl-D-alanine carboxypeptidase (penicillin-binding protein 5/6)